MLRGRSGARHPRHACAKDRAARGSGWLRSSHPLRCTVARHGGDGACPPDDCGVPPISYGTATTCCRWVLVWISCKPARLALQLGCEFPLQSLDGMLERLAENPTLLVGDGVERVDRFRARFD